MRGVDGTLIGLNVAVFGLERLYPQVLAPLALWPLGVQPRAGFASHFAPWQPLTYAFLHGGLAHLALNMFALWMFGRDCERALGVADDRRVGRRLRCVADLRGALP